MGYENKVLGNYIIGKFLTISVTTPLSEIGVEEK